VPTPVAPRRPIAAIDSPPLDRGIGSRGFVALRRYARTVPDTQNDQPSYKLSFTSGGLFLRGAAVAARLFAETDSWVQTREIIDRDNLLQARTSSSAKRLGRELVQRMQELTQRELQLLTEASSDESAQIMWAAACRRYLLVGEFAENVLRERYLLMATDVLPEHFEAFLRGQSLWHPELGGIKESTMRKLRTNTFLMMRQADLITVEGSIVPAVISSRVRDEFSKRSVSDVRFFPTREAA